MNKEQETSLDDISWPEVEWEKLEVIDVIFYDADANERYDSQE